MSGKKYSKKEKADYYNSERINEIIRQISFGNYEQSYALALNYMDDYPEDALGPFYLARSLASLGRFDEAYETAKNAMETSIFHNIQAELSAYHHYSTVLSLCGKNDEALMVLDHAMKRNTSRQSDKYYLKLNFGLIDIMMDMGLYEQAFQYSFKFYDMYKNELFLLKEANALLALKRNVDAIRILKSIRFDAKGMEQQRLLTLGNAYNNIYQNDTKKLHAFESAEKYYHQSLIKKNFYYYEACIKLAHLELIKDNYDEAIRYANLIIDNKESKCEDEEKNIKLVNEAYRVLVLSYLDMGEYKRSEEYLEKIPEDQKRGVKISFLYSTKQYAETIKYADSIIDDITNEDLRVYVLTFKIYGYIRLNKYEEAIDLIETHKDELDERFAEKMMAFINSKLNYEHGEYTCYTSNQIKNYNEEETVKHICDRHLDLYKSMNFKDEETIRSLLAEAKGKLSDLDYVPTGITNKYIVRSENIKTKEDTPCYAMAAIVIPDTTNIITLFPIVASRSTYKSEHKSKEIKVRSGLDRFNARYGDNN